MTTIEIGVTGNNGQIINDVREIKSRIINAVKKKDIINEIGQLIKDKSYRTIHLPLHLGNLVIERQYYYSISETTGNRHRFKRIDQVVESVSDNNSVQCDFDCHLIISESDEIPRYQSGVLVDVPLELVCIEYNGKFIEPKIYYHKDLHLPETMLHGLAEAICQSLPNCYDQKRINGDIILQDRYPYCEFFKHNKTKVYKNNEILLRFGWPMIKMNLNKNK
jgi:hypothetical protein